MKTRLLIVVSLLVSSVVYGQKIKKFNTMKDDYESVPKMNLKRYKSVQDRVGQDSNLAVGVSLSGGGSRAQFFSLGVLMGLEEIEYKESNVLKETDYFSTVSGGGLAAGLYYRYLIEKDSTSFNQYLSKFKVLPRVNIFTPIPNMLHPGVMHKRYVTKINKAIFDKGKGKYTYYYLDNIMPLKNQKSSVEYPFIIPNAAVYSNGDLYQFVPDVLKPDSLKKELNIIKAYKGQGGKSRILYHGFYAGYPLAFGLAVSSAFPRMLPHQNLYTENDERTITVFDGGLYDNLGITSLDSVLKQENVAKKKLAIVVNSSGSGSQSPYANPKELKFFNFLGKALLYPVDMNILRNKKNLSTLFGDSHIYLELSQFKKYITNKKDPQIIALTSGKSSYRSQQLYKSLVKSLKERSLVADNRIFAIPWNRLPEITDYEKFLIYEIATHTKTKLRIKEHELNTLILAGRIMVSKNQKTIEDKLKK